MKATTMYAVIWIVTAFTVLLAIYLTKNGNCFAALFIPLFVRFKSE